MGAYKQQHTITEAYLRGFTSEATPNTLWRYDKIDETCEAKNVEKATVKFYAYSFREADGSWNHSVEQLFGEVESVAIPLLPKLAAGIPISDVEKDHLALFIATIIRRPAALLEHFHEYFLQYANDPNRLSSFFDSLLPKLKQRFSQQEIDAAREGLLRGEFDISFDRAKAQQMAVWMQSAPRNSHIIANMHWQIWKADKGFDFLTSDAPAFVRRNGGDDDLGVVGIARADLGAELTFPISRRSLLIASHKPLKPVCKATKSRVQELNGQIIWMAYRHVFAATASDNTGRLVALNKEHVAPLPNLSEVRAINDARHGILLDKAVLPKQ